MKVITVILLSAISISLSDGASRKVKNGGTSFVVKLPMVLHNRNATAKQPKTAEQKQAIVETTEGKVRGLLQEKYGYKYYTFMGIPYGAQPLRFQTAEAAAPWSGVLDGTTRRDACLHLDRRFRFVTGNEDCLHVDVYTPRLPSANNRNKRKAAAALLPVVVWVHGGSFNYGVTAAFGSWRLAAHAKSVVVGVTYRLGVFGFLDAGVAEAPGNVGLKDVRLALRWIRRNIARFGGDPEKVVLYGCSSGGTAAEMLTLDPTTKGLYSSVYSQSGGMIGSYLHMQENPRMNAIALARSLGETSVDPAKVVQRLRAVNATELLVAADRMRHLDLLGAATFTPTTERPIPGEVPIVSLRPHEALTTGAFVDVPFFASVTNREGLGTLHEDLDAKEFARNFEHNIKSIIPLDFAGKSYAHFKQERTLADLRSRLFPSDDAQPIDSDANVLRLLDGVADIQFYFDAFRGLELRKARAKSDIFLMHFAYESDFNAHHKTMLNVSGVGHAEDLAFVFDLPFSEVKPDTPPEVALVADRMTKMIANMAEFGNPSPNRTKLLPVVFEPFNKDDEWRYLELTNKMEMKSGNWKKEEYEFIKQLYLQTNDIPNK